MLQRIEFLFKETFARLQQRYSKPVLIFAIASILLTSTSLIVFAIVHSRGSLLSESQPQLKSVRVATIETKTLFEEFKTQSSLLPVHEAVQRAPAQSTIKEIVVKWGQAVKKDQALVEIDSDLHRLRSELDKLELANKGLDYNLTQALNKKKYISGVEYKQKTMEYKAFQIRQRMSDLESSKILKSPIDGIVAEISMKAGDFVDGNSNLFVKVIDISQFKIQLYVPHSIASLLQSGDTAKLSRPELRGPASTDSVSTAEAVVAAVSPIIDPKSGSVFVELLVDKVPTGWMPGLFVDTKLQLNKVENAISLPEEAVFFVEGKPFVFKVTSENGIEKTIKTEVQLGINDGTFFQVKSGLEEFDQVVVEGQGQLRDGENVEVLQ